ncbi:P-loop containing nucleoside triphosphate hydrolase protein [Madurella fahalii]|uniref:P-loop containing nucleoside triphosphate hydrolase protein n=1 Tax=Madurella fahalii TaxID=1157608 RepID=A0ABQ0GKZ4_9PEZI
MSAPIKPLYRFANVAEFAHRHKTGTDAEFAAEERLIDEINKQENKFRAWIVSKTRRTAKRDEYLLLVQPGPGGEYKLPQQGEPAKIRIILGDGSLTRFSDAWRIEIPTELLGITAEHPEKLAAFHVTVFIAEAHEGIQPLISGTYPPRQPGATSEDVTPSNRSDTSSESWDARSNSSDNDTQTTSATSESSGGFDEVKLASCNAIRVNFLLTASESTKNAELAALEQLYGKHQNATERQIKAFEYFVLLRDPDFVVDLHHEIPHLTTAMQETWWPTSRQAKKFALLNPQQKAAYMHGFNNLPCGICILPGGPGAGKTHFNLFTIAMAQLKPLPRPVRVKGQLEKLCAKVLFIVDMNSPVDDVANRMVRLYDELGMKKSIIRMKGWGSEVKLSGRLNSAEDAASEEMHVDFSQQFLRTANLMALGNGPAGRRACTAPSLDEAAWQRYDTHKATKYEELTKFMTEDLWESSDVIPLRLRRLVYNLYRDTLAAADFIATTPVAASNHFRGMFKPDLVYFDEAPHARELSNLIAIANFDPIAWIFCGDYRQTVPFVGSDSIGSKNIYRSQMQVSMMERAAIARVIRYELLMNHRSFGGLHQLASALWYGGRMVSGNNQVPVSLPHIQRYLQKLAGGKPCTVPRLLVHIKNCGPEGRDGTSSWNPTHTLWVMARVRELLRDEYFRHAERDEPGSILIISPYKKAYDEYKKAIKRLPHWAQKRVETRTVDVVQGHEADFVFLDLVKDKSTGFLDNPNRLCVAVTRARLGEVIMMHPKMPESSTFLKHSRNLHGIYTLCREAGQLVSVDPESAADSAPRTELLSSNIPARPIGFSSLGPCPAPRPSTGIVKCETAKVVDSQLPEAENESQTVNKPAADEMNKTGPGKDGLKKEEMIHSDGLTLAMLGAMLA